MTKGGVRKELISPKDELVIKAFGGKPPRS